MLRFDSNSDKYCFQLLQPYIGSVCPNIMLVMTAVLHRRLDKVSGP